MRTCTKIGPRISEKLVHASLRKWSTIVYLCTCTKIDPRIYTCAHVPKLVHESPKKNRNFGFGPLNLCCKRFRERMVHESPATPPWHTHTYIHDGTHTHTYMMRTYPHTYIHDANICMYILGACILYLCCAVVSGGSTVKIQ